MEEINIDQFPENELFDNLIPEIDIDKLSNEIESFSVTTLSTFTNEEFSKQLIKVAKGYLGVTRSTDLAQIAKFLSLFDLPTKMDGKWVPFCAAGASYAAAKAYCDLAGIAYTADNSITVFRKVLPQIRDRFFLPSPSCWQMQQAATNKGNWAKKGTIKPFSGWLLLYNWDGETTPHHVGIVEVPKDDSVQTVEFNTSVENDSNGGGVSIRNRSYNPVLGYIKTF